MTAPPMEKKHIEKILIKVWDTRINVCECDKSVFSGLAKIVYNTHQFVLRARYVL
jgi:hypothetical protein